MSDLEFQIAKSDFSDLYKNVSAEFKNEMTQLLAQKKRELEGFYHSKIMELEERYKERRDQRILCQSSDELREENYKLRELLVLTEEWMEARSNYDITKNEEDYEEAQRRKYQAFALAREVNFTFSLHQN